MDEAISAADANRKFSSVLRKVREGQSYVVTSLGRAVARIVPMGAGDAGRSNAKDLLLDRLARQETVDIGPARLLVRRS